MKKCACCGGKVWRVHRTFLDRLKYMAIYRCRECKALLPVPRRYRHRLGKHSRCPKCGTLRVTKLKERDRIDPMSGGLINLLQRLAGGGLFHCRYCRIQYYDRRKLATPPATPAPLRTPRVRPSGVSEQTPVDPYRLSGNEVPALARKKGDSASDIDRFSDASEGG